MAQEQDIFITYKVRAIVIDLNENLNNNMCKKHLKQCLAHSDNSHHCYYHMLFSKTSNIIFSGNEGALYITN